MSGTSSKKSRYLIVSGGILLLAIIGIIGFIIVRGQLKEKNYLEAIKTAEKYKEEENYADAIVAYKNAIKEAPKKAEAYLNLADVHLIQNQVSEAKLTLRKGYVKTNSQKIKYMLNGIEDGTLLLQYEKDDTDKKELFEVRGEFGWNTSFLQKLENYTFQDYQDEYGNFPEILKTGAGKLEVVHRDLKGICYYSNTKEDNEIVDVKKNKPDVAGMPQTITLDSVSLLFRNFNGSVSLDQLRKLSGEKVEPVRTDERTYVTLKTGDVIIKIETDASGNVTSENAWNEIQLPNANKNRGKKGHLSGVVIDAVSGDGVAGAVLEFKAEKNRASSSETNTKNDGSFSIELEEDVYSVKISAEGYLMEEFEFEIEKNKNYSGEQFVISPELAQGSARIVLEWGAEPRDLDSYLFGETDNGDNVFVNYRNKECNGSNGKIAELDVDTVNGYGPETITIHNLNGVYQYKVADFQRTQTMKEYGATVKVYLPGKSQPEVITIAPGADVKDIWEVFELDHGELKILNKAPAEDRFTNGNK